MSLVIFNALQITRVITMSKETKNSFYYINYLDTALAFTIPDVEERRATFSKFSSQVPIAN